MTYEELETLEKERHAKAIGDLLTDVRRGVRGASWWLANGDAEQAATYLVCSLRNVLKSPELKTTLGRIEETRKNDEPSKERILAHLEACANDFDDDRERYLGDLKEDCEKFLAGTINEYNTGRISILRCVINEIRNNFKLED